MTRFLINKKGVYYLTTGTLLEYDPAAAQNTAQKDGVKEVKREFDRIRNLPHTFYEAVEITDSRFAPIQTRMVQ